jgi:hypothetical protein
MFNLHIKKIPKEYKVTSGFLENGTYQVVEEVSTYIITITLKIGKWEKIWVLNK